MTRIAAVILAGGRGERLGGTNKALLPFGDGTLGDRALAATHGCAPVLLSVGRADFALPGPRHIMDLPTDYAGPLAGVAAAIATLASDPPELLLSLAVDTPFFPLDFVERARPLIEEAPAAVAAFGGQPYPTNALWRLTAIADLPGRLRTGTAPHSLKRLAAELGGALLDYSAWTATDPFLNANTPEDLAALRAQGT